MTTITQKTSQRIEGEWEEIFFLSESVSVAKKRKGLRHTPFPFTYIQTHRYVASVGLSN